MNNEPSLFDDLFPPLEKTAAPEKKERKIQDKKEPAGPKEEVPPTPPPPTNRIRPKRSEIMRFTMDHPKTQLGIIVVNENPFSTDLTWYAYERDLLLTRKELLPEDACAKGTLTESDCPYLDDMWEYDKNKIKEYLTSQIRTKKLTVPSPAAKTFTPQA